MDSQLTRPDHIETPIKIRHPEEEEHHEKGTTKVLKKAKEKAKKIKDSLTKHGHHQEDDGDDDDDITRPEADGAQMYESAALRGGVTGQPESLSHPGKSQIPAPEEIVPPGTRVFPVVSSVQTKPIEPVRESEPIHGLDSSHGFGELAHPTAVSDISDRKESREAHLAPHNTPVPLLSGTEDVIRMFVLPEEQDPLGQRRVNLYIPEGLEEDPTAPGGGFGSSGVVSNYQTKVTDPTGKNGEEIEVTSIIESLGKMSVISGHGSERESPMRGDEHNVKSGHEAGKDLPIKRHELDVKLGHELVKDLPTGSHDQFSPELSPPKPLENPTATETEVFSTQAMAADDEDMPKQSIYAEKIVSATLAIADKAAAAKNALASKLGYSGREEEETPRSAMEYGKKMASTVTEKLTPIYEKVKETGTRVMTKTPLSGDGDARKGQDKGVSAREYLAEKLKPGEEDRVLSDVISEKLDLGGEKRRSETVTDWEETKTKSAETTLVCRDPVRAGGNDRR
ncbi:PREDICTED: low-temperature-induced 65 kDa protein-like isoform X2 [Tarenaya hassleriana]|uniref:low-temperature-induced 65 kDa protein-like isoform X2 n=1 Tax=Tarenaya hassleriana TaxID=28532 RepID=UPI00053C260D|nr:PREDICTED: low-temperature-induced 65 kDa protein-like isoform X2 [Tarenaya hassleriana]